MAQRNDDWLVTHIVTAEPIKPKEKGIGFFGWVGLIVLGLVIYGLVIGH